MTNSRSIQTERRLDLATIEQLVPDLVAKQLGFERDEVLLSSRLIEDLGCDSLELIELIMELEDQFNITIPDKFDDPVGKSMFTRSPFCIRDLAEIVYLQHGTGTPVRSGWHRKITSSPKPVTLFTQLGGRWTPESTKTIPALFEELDRKDDIRQFRRRSDGMRCFLLPTATVEVGNNDPDVPLDERPAHSVQIDSFLIDAEPVSTTAYCRFLNSIETTEKEWLDWFQLAENDDRIRQMPIVLTDGSWQPVVGSESMPMVLVSWFGANAYSLWANGKQWTEYQTSSGFLPTEAQWEYAALGAFDPSVSGDQQEPSFIYGQHERGNHYEASTMPIADVHIPVGLSKFHLHHMVGNVWHWCRDWFAEDFYQRPESRTSNPVNSVETGIRSERGGSWVGPIDLCRPTYRRGRTPLARGRCLGFRCVSPVEMLGTVLKSFN